MSTVSNQLYAPTRLWVPPEQRKLDIIALVSPTLLSGQEMTYWLSKRQQSWGRYAHDDVPALVRHIEERPGTLYVARRKDTNASASGIAGSLEAYKIQTHGDPKNIPPTAEEVRINGDAKEPDTVLLFQFEAYSDDEKSTVAQGQLIRDVISFAVDTFRAYPNLFTYSPKEAVRIHRRFGAVPVHVFPNGRRHHIDPHVAINSYWSEKPLKGLTDQEIEDWIKSSLEIVPSVPAA